MSEFKYDFNVLLLVNNGKLLCVKHVSVNCPDLTFFG